MFTVIFIMLVITNTFVSSLQKENVLETKLKPRVSGNEIFDTILHNVVGNDVGLKRFTAIPIPNLHKELKANLLMMQVGISLTATDGVFSGLTTMRRISEVTNHTVGNTTYFTAGVTLDDLHITFNRYSLQLGVFHKTGARLTLNVGKNSFIVILKSHVNGPNCQLTLDDLKVSELSDMEVEISELSFFGHIVTWFTDYLYEEIDKITEAHSKDMVNYVIKHKRICEELFKDELADQVRMNSSTIGTSPHPKIEETHPTKPVHDEGKISGDNPESTYFTLWTQPNPKSDESKKPHRVSKNESDKITMPLPQAEDLPSTPQASSQNIPTEDINGDILEMIDKFPSMTDS